MYTSHSGVFTFTLCEIIKTADKPYNSVGKPAKTKKLMLNKNNIYMQVKLKTESIERLTSN